MNADRLTRVVVDTNVLLAATDRSRATHLVAVEFLNSDERRLCLTPQIVREYLAVATRPREVNGFGLSGDDAAANMGQFLEDMDILAENAGTTDAVINMVARGSSLGKQVHDANIVGVALRGGASTIVTDNVRHFARFADLITIENLGID